jgi:hypothetical protein
MYHRGVEYTVVRSETPGFWYWRFRIGETIKTGKTKTNMELLAMRRVQLQIDRSLNGVTRGYHRRISRPSVGGQLD